MDDKIKTLTRRQARFVDEYVVDFNAAAACRRAGFSVLRSSSTGRDMMSLPHVQLAIKEKVAKIIEKSDVKAVDVINKLAAILTTEMREVIDFNTYEVRKDISKKAHQAIRKVKVKYNPFTCKRESVEIELYSAIDAADMLCKHYGLYELDNQQKPNEINMIAILDGLRRGGVPLNPAIKLPGIPTKEIDNGSNNQP